MVIWEHLEQFKRFQLRSLLDAMADSNSLKDEAIPVVKGPQQGWVVAGGVHYSFSCKRVIMV